MAASPPEGAYREVDEGECDCQSNDHVRHRSGLAGLNFLPLPPRGCEAHCGKHREEKTCDLKNEDARRSCGGLPYTLGRSHSTSDRVMAVAKPPQNTPHSMGSLKMS